MQPDFSLFSPISQMGWSVHKKMFGSNPLVALDVILTRQTVNVVMELEKYIYHKIDVTVIKSL